MDTDLVSLLGLALLANPEIIHELHTITVSQLPLSLYFMTRSQLLKQITLRHQDRSRRVTSLLQTLDLIDASFQTVTFRRIFDRPVLQLSRKRLLLQLAFVTGEAGPPAGTTLRTPQTGNPQQCNRGVEYLRWMLNSAGRLYEIISTQRP